MDQQLGPVSPLPASGFVPLGATVTLAGDTAFPSVPDREPRVNQGGLKPLTGAVTRPSETWGSQRGP